MIEQPAIEEANDMTEPEWMLRGLTASFIAAAILAVIVECCI
jgi:hypothetical protein